MTEMYLKCVPILFKLLRRIIDPIGDMVYVFTYNPLIIDCHYSVLYPVYQNKIRWSESTPLYEGLTFHPKDFVHYPCVTPDFTTCIHKRHILGLQSPYTSSFDIITIDDYIAF